MAKARKDYYLKKLGDISPREDYYLRGGIAVGHWTGGGAAELGLAGTVSAQGLVRLFDGRHPETGDQLGRRLRKDGVAAWDLTFSADKSVSLLWAFGDPGVRRQVVEAFEEATAEALTYLESVASSTRGAARTPIIDLRGDSVLGAHAKQRFRTETWPIRTRGYMAAWFTEFTSRADDPQLHTHVVVANRVKGVDGVWRALDGRLLYRHKLAAGYIHEAELRHRLTERLGVRWQPVRNGVADIEGFTRDQIMAFSQRRQEIEQWRDHQGLADTAAANEVATLATRTPKQDHPLDALVATWLQRGAEVGITPESVARLLNRGRAITVPAVESLFDEMSSPHGLTAQSSTFNRADAIKKTAAALPEGGKRADIEAVADEYLHSSTVVPILPYRPTDDIPVDLPIDLDPDQLDHLLDLTRSIRLPTMRRHNGDLFPGLVNERRYTTAELLVTEQRVIDRALAGVSAGRWAVAEQRVDNALDRQEDLTDGQRKMVRRFATSGDAIEVGIGAAGTGKTTVMSIIGQLTADTGTSVLGTALAARAAAGFEAATGIPSFTIARLLWEAREGGGLPDGVVVIVDEAGMVGTRHIAAISDLVEAAHGKLILIGDHRQLAEIDAGGLFTALAARLHAVELTENVRQLEEWERTALSEMRDGSVSRAAAMYDRRQRFNVFTSSAEAVAQAVDAWYRDVADVGDPSEVLLIADRNATVDQLNHQARDLMTQDGYLVGPALTVGKHEFRTGDRVVCLRNHTRLAVLNGDLATVTTVDTERWSVVLLLDRTGQTATIPRWYLDAGHLDWGYALTGHKAQGATARRAHVVAGSGTDREWIYVAMSRGQEANVIYLTEPDLNAEQCEHVTHQRPDQLPALVTALGRSAVEPSAVDTGRGPRELTDEQLWERCATLENMLIAEATSLADHDQPSRETRDEVLLEYVRLRREAEARRRDAAAVAAYSPPRRSETLGDGPFEPERAASDPAAAGDPWRRAMNNVANERSLRPGAAERARERGRSIS